MMWWYQDLNGQSVYKPVGCWVHHEVVVAKEIHTNNEDLNISQQRCPAEPVALEKGPPLGIHP
jgi:hypothetical protein